MSPVDPLREAKALTNKLLEANEDTATGPAIFTRPDHEISVLTMFAAGGESVIQSVISS